MTAHEHDRVCRVFLRVCDLPLIDRDRALDDACGNDIALRRAVLELLAEDTAEDGVLTDKRIDSGDHLPDLTATEFDPLHQDIGSFRVHRKLGEGAMGVVYEAQQVSPNRRVAVKIIRTTRTSRAGLSRFRREAEVLGMLQHPGIAQVFESGSHSGRPYIAMELIEGESLTRYAEAAGLGTRARLELIARVADAVHHAHQKGVVHRDLKPDNILVAPASTASPTATGSAAEFGTVGQPKVLDFGIARATDGLAGMTATETIQGQLIGTLAYMSPEQISGERDIDTRTDVHAMGIIAYELLTGELPNHTGTTTLADALLRRTQDRPMMLGATSRDFRGDIETIIAKAMEPDRARRYQSAAEFAADIRRHLNSQPIEARPQSLGYQFSRFARRNRGLVIAGVIAVLAVIAGTALTGVYAARNARLLHRQESMLYAAMVESASRALTESDVELARRQLANAPESFRGWEWRHLQTRTDLTLRSRTLGEDINVPVPSNIVWLDPGRFRVLVFEGNTLSCLDVHAETLEVVDRVSIVTLDSGARALAMMDPTGEHVILASREASAYHTQIYQVGNPEPLGTHTYQRSKAQRGEPVPVELTAGFLLGLHLDMPLIAEHAQLDHPRLGRIAAIPQLIGADPTLGIISLPSGRVIHSISLQRRGRGSGIFMPDGSVLIAEEGGYVQAFDPETGQEHAWNNNRVTDTTIQNLAHSSDPNICILSTLYGENIWLDYRYGEVRANLQDSLRTYRTGSTRPGSGEFFALDDVGRVTVWHSASGDPFALHGHDHWVDPLVISKDGSTVTTGDWEGSVRTWDLVELTQLREFRLPPSGDAYTVVDDLALAPSGDRLAVVSSSGWNTPHTVEIRDRITGSVLERAATIERAPTYARFHTDGRLFISSRWESTTELHEDAVHIGNATTPVVFAPDQSGFGAVVIQQDSVSTLRVFDTQTLGIVVEFKLPPRITQAVSFSPDGRRIVTAGEDRNAYVWDIRDGTLLGTLSGHTDTILDVAWSPDGSRIATAGRDMTIGIWDTKNLTKLVSLRGHRSFVNSVAWSPDGTELISASSDRSVRVWSAGPPPQLAGTGVQLRASSTE